MTSDNDEPTAAASARPQSLMFSFLGIYVLDREVAVYSGSIIDVFARLGVSEEAVRSTLARMTKRGLLARHRRGRKAYFGLTPHAAEVLEDGRRRVRDTGAINRDWDGTWTLVGFTLPNDRGSARHDLRSRLTWAGFAPLQGGLWIAAGSRDVVAALAPLGLGDHITTLRARPTGLTDSADLVRRAFDVEAVAARYRAFLERWDTSTPPVADDDLACQILLHTDWLQLVRQDPHLPAEHLPEHWPAIRAEQVFRLLDQKVAPGARAAAELLDEIEL
ncbi:PaaX family transcriptional regulator C-terminal domain-containing protein [Streptomyces sp. TRM 70361]|uniref:PaaX family transcriptional regulator n=1 Tax=Streptomyces sp. TRM 70361 TaxID=3116553 RepID=UPI002E7C237E|nr:PaaX family transcriptional regulator C-terminal domain-containing protein [Streptomyces sp. TRM 70361]MEE1940967.1 PaaX family transcriptional regulator C-terminal domain-containing protein [Streptomyces sp. TRM 70361]